MGLIILWNVLLRTKAWNYISKRILILAYNLLRSRKGLFLTDGYLSGIHLSKLI